ncbi:MAG: hypothetical protein NTW62_02460 [Candidatus Nomurabacteria bacterium]|nr:hypothetical protein [Candidatus Nomurabacteria bacterium]
MLINPKIKEIVFDRYQELKKENKMEDIFNEESFGGLRIFINKKPKYSLASFEIEDNDEKVEVFLGSDTI